MSISLRNLVPAHLEHFTPAGRMSSAERLYHASAPSRANSSTTLRLIVLSLRNSLQFSHWKTAIGTPHNRWREMHQSGRVAIMFEMRSSPQAGSHFTLLISSSERLRKVPPGSLPS